MADINKNKPGLSAEVLAKAGYKKTKVGWIPEEWEVITLESIAAVSGGYAFKSQKMQSQGEYQIVKMSNVYNGTLDLTRNPSFVSLLTERETEAKLFEGDMIISLTGTIGKRDYGYTVLIDNTKNLLLNQRLAKIVADKKNDQVYLYYTTKSSSFLNQFFLEGLGGTGNQANVGISDLKRIKIPLPPLPEQHQIATLLSTWGTAIDKLGQLIAQKQALKKGLMQQLLSGRVRFPEFVPAGGTKYKETKVGWVPEDWEVVKVGDVFQVDPESINPKEHPEFEFRYLSLSSIERGKIIETPIVYKLKDAPSRARRIIRKGDVLLSTVRPNLEGHYFVKGHEAEVASTGFAVIRSKSEVSEEFFYQYIFSQGMRRQIHALVVGSNYPAINSSDVKKLKIPSPSVEEQIKIKKVLFELDLEINKLSQEKTFLQTQKKGLMQQLLTGAVRVAGQSA